MGKDSDNALARNGIPGVLVKYASDDDITSRRQNDEYHRELSDNPTKENGKCAGAVEPNREIDSMYVGGGPSTVPLSSFADATCNRSPEKTKITRPR